MSLDLLTMLRASLVWLQATGSGHGDRSPWSAFWIRRHIARTWLRRDPCPVSPQLPLGRARLVGQAHIISESAQNLEAAQNLGTAAVPCLALRNLPRVSRGISFRAGHGRLGFSKCSTCPLGLDELQRAEHQSVSFLVAAAYADILFLFLHDPSAFSSLLPTSGGTSHQHQRPPCPLASHRARPRNHQEIQEGEIRGGGSGGPRRVR